MQIAVLGAGFSGLAVAWNLAQNSKYRIVIFDPLGIGKGASGVAAGLLHPYAGARSKQNWRAEEGFKATLDLIAVAESHLGCKIASSNGLLRLATSTQQQKDFFQCSEEHADVCWRTAAENLNDIPSLLPYPGIFIESAVVVDCEQYLKGLWMACTAVGVEFEQKAIKSLTELDTFDHVVVAMGAASNTLPELSHLKITPIKGQVLKMKWPEDVPTLPYPISSQVYLLKNPTELTCTAGATFERYFNEEAPNQQQALEEILPKVQAIFPRLDSSHVISCRSGVRASCAHHRPLLTCVGKGRWVLTGMGSKGLLYHALFAQELAHLISTS